MSDKYEAPKMPESARIAGEKRDRESKRIKERYNNFLNTLNRDKNDKIYPTRKNIVKIIEFDDNLNKLVGYNQFTETPEVLHNFNYGTHRIKKGNYKDNYNLIIADYIENNSYYPLKGNLKTDVVNEAFIITQDNNSFNPIKKYFEDAGKKWDGKSRIESFFEDFLGVKEEIINGLDVTNLIAKLFFISGAKKALEPTYNNQLTLDLIGGQGAGKTTVARMLAPSDDYYIDSFNDFTDKDNLNRMSEAFIVNDDEMTASKRTSFSELKKFLTQNEFQYRKPYDKYDTKKQKKFITIRTSNEITYLRDKTGARRFMPLRVSKERQKKHPAKYLTKQYVLQLWGEAVNRRDELENLIKTSSDKESILNSYRTQFEYRDEIEDALNDVLDNEFKDKKFIPSTDLCKALFDDEDPQKHNKEFKKIKFLMESTHGFINTRYRIKGKQVRGYLKQ